MKNQKPSSFSNKVISRRTCLTSGLGLVAMYYLTSSAVVLSPVEGVNEKPIVIEGNYILIDGWLLRTDDLKLQV